MPPKTASLERRPPYRQKALGTAAGTRPRAGEDQRGGNPGGRPAGG